MPEKVNDQGIADSALEPEDEPPPPGNVRLDTQGMGPAPDEEH